MGKRRLWWILAGALAALGVAALFFGREEPPPVPAGAPMSGPASPADPISGSVVEASAEEVPILVEATGRVASTREVVLSTKVQGTIETLSVREGSVVQAGQTLMTLDNRHLLAQAAAADAELENARDRLARMEKLFAEESVAKQELENAQRAYKVAAAAREGLAVQLSYTVVKAPFAGVVTEKKVEVGELASPGLPLLKVEDVTRLRLEATVPESDLKAVNVGDKVPVLVDAVGVEPLQGSVARVLPTGDPSTHTFLVKVDLPAVRGLKSGMFGRLRFQHGSARATLVPRSAVVARGELTGVFVVGGDKVARLRFVKLGRSFGSRMEVASGLTAGEKVLEDGARGRDGAPVIIR
jgi:RND family efflux transporter MFP subunit